MKKVLALVLAMMMALGLVAAVAEQPTYHFEIVSKGFQSTYWQALYKGALGFNKRNRKNYYEMLAASGKHVIIFKSRRQIKQYLESL